MYAVPTLWNILYLGIRLLPVDSFKKNQDASISEVLKKWILINLFIDAQCHLKKNKIVTLM